MSGIQVPRHRGNPILLRKHGKRTLRLLSAKAMFDLSGQTTYRLIVNEMPDPGRRRQLQQIAETLSQSMTPPSSTLIQIPSPSLKSKSKRSRSSVSS